MFGEIRIHCYFCLFYFSDTEGTHHPLKSNLLKEKIVSFKVQEKVNYTFCNSIKFYFNNMNQKKMEKHLLCGHDKPGSEIWR